MKFAVAFVALPILISGEFFEEDDTLSLIQLRASQKKEERIFRDGEPIMTKADCQAYAESFGKVPGTDRFKFNFDVTSTLMVGCYYADFQVSYLPDFPEGRFAGGSTCKIMWASTSIDGEEGNAMPLGEQFNAGQPRAEQVIDPNVFCPMGAGFGLAKGICNPASYPAGIDVSSKMRLPNNTLLTTHMQKLLGTPGQAYMQQCGRPDPTTTTTTTTTPVPPPPPPPAPAGMGNMGMGNMGMGNMGMGMGKMGMGKMGMGKMGMGKMGMGMGMGNGDDEAEGDYYYADGGDDDADAGGAGDQAEAVGDPHLTTVYGKKYDLIPEMAH